MEQMQHISCNLKSLNHEWIAILSPMLRAQESFNVINNNLKIPSENVFIIDEMKEMNFGDFEGQKKEDIKNHSFFEERKRDKWNTAYPNGESYEDLYNRVLNSDFLNIFKLAQKSFKHVLVVGHGSLNKVIPLVIKKDKSEKDEVIKIQQANNEVILFDGDCYYKNSFL